MINSHRWEIIRSKAHNVKVFENEVEKPTGEKLLSDCSIMMLVGSPQTRFIKRLSCRIVSAILRTRMPMTWACGALNWAVTSSGSCFH